MPDLKIVPLEITLSIENVLRGRVTSSTLTFYSFGFSANNRKLFRLFIYFPVLGDHRVFFLKEEGGVMRSVGDVSDYTIPVRSGSHMGLAPPPESSLGQSITWLLLTPGEGYRPESFASDLGLAYSISAELGSEAYALELLGRLARNEDKSVRQRASDLIVGITTP